MFGPTWTDDAYWSRAAVSPGLALAPMLARTGVAVELVEREPAAADG